MFLIPALLGSSESRLEFCHYFRGRIQLMCELRLCFQECETDLCNIHLLSIAGTSRGKLYGTKYCYTLSPSTVSHDDTENNSCSCEAQQHMICLCLKPIRCHSLVPPDPAGTSASASKLWVTLPHSDDDVGPFEPCSTPFF
jgi:hypothetical protein